MQNLKTLYLSCPSTYRQFNGKAHDFAVAGIARQGYRRLCLSADGEVISEPYFIKEVS
jgi:hypothetical protein